MRMNNIRHVYTYTRKSYPVQCSTVAHACSLLIIRVVEAQRNSRHLKAGTEHDITNNTCSSSSLLLSMLSIVFRTFLMVP